MSTTLLLLAEHHVAVRQLLADQENGVQPARPYGAYGGGLVLGALFAVAGYRETRKVREETGRLAGGLEPWIWALLCLLFSVFALIALVYTCRSTRKKGPIDASALAGSLPAPYVPPQPGVPQAPMTIDEAWAPPAYGAQGSGFPPPVAAPPAIGSRIAVDVLPAAQPKRRFR